MKLKELLNDNRGGTYILEDDNLGYPEVAIFYTKQDYARGGCIHRKSDEYLCVISGEIRFFSGDDNIYMKSGMILLTPKETPHYFVSLTDSIVMEWGASPEEKKEKYVPFRNMVNKINDKSDRT